MNHEIMLYGIAQKEQLGFDKAVEECKYRMSRYGVTPNMLVMPPQMLLYMALAPEQKLTYKEGGPAAEARFEAGLAGFEARSFRGCGVMVRASNPLSPTHTALTRRKSDRASLCLCVQTSEPFEVSDDNESLQMLTRNSQIGEFYVMAPPQVEPKDSSLHTCDIMVFDEERDAHVRITWEDAMNATLVNDDKFYAGTTPGTKMEDGTKDGKKLDDWKSAAGAWNDFNKGTAPEGGFGTLDPNVRIVVARPFIEHTMRNVIMAGAGRDTGATL